MISKPDNIRTIETVLNLDTGDKIYSNILFDNKENEHIVFSYREKCQEAISERREPFLVCEVCGQMVQISGGKGINGKIKYFKHLKDSKDCPIKTDTKLSKDLILRGKFNGQKEGKLHIETKQYVFDFLCYNQQNKGEVTFVKQEMVNKSIRDHLEWKKPDVTSVFNHKNLVFEIQLATTFLNVICDRQYFYKDNQTFIIWVFKSFDIESDKQRFTQKDVFYSNNRNAFILDEEAIRLSQNNKDLYLLCQYQIPKEQEEGIGYVWESKYVSLKDLTFDKNSYKVYYYDVNAEEEKVRSDIEKKKLALKEKEKERLRLFYEWEEEERRIEKDEEKLKFEQEETERRIQKHKAERQQGLKKEHQDFVAKNFSFFERLENYGNLSPLQNVFLANFYQINEQIDILFKKGYQPCEEDLKFIKNEYQLERRNYKIPDRYSILYFLSLITFYCKLNKNPEYLKVFPRVERVLIAILSIKEKIVIGYSFKTLIQIPHQFIGNPSRQEFSKPILEAIKSYYGYDSFIQEQDKKKTLEKKIQSLNGNIPNLPDKYKKIVSIVFKDLIL